LSDGKDAGIFLREKSDGLLGYGPEWLGLKGQGTIKSVGIEKVILKHTGKI